ncbi:MAG: hypothetical protein HUJ31_12140 [Pseudomonadales bacterium]|nr:hypothetical protein [Pseudomonadales bacterium]
MGQSEPPIAQAIHRVDKVSNEPCPSHEGKKSLLFLTFPFDNSKNNGFYEKSIFEAIADSTSADTGIATARTIS